MWSGWLSKNERGVCLADCVWAEATLLGRTLSCVWQEASASPVQGLKKLFKMCPFIINTVQNMGLLKFLTKTSLNKTWYFLLPKWAASVRKSIKRKFGFWLNHFVIFSIVTHKDYSANFSRKVIESFQFHDTFIRSMIFDDFQKYRSHLMSGASPCSSRHLSHFVAPCPTGALRKNPALQGPWHRELGPYKTCRVVKIKKSFPLSNLSGVFGHREIGVCVCVRVCVCTMCTV